MHEFKDPDYFCRVKENQRTFEDLFPMNVKDQESNCVLK